MKPLAIVCISFFISAMCLGDEKYQRALSFTAIESPRPMGLYGLLESGHHTDAFFDTDGYLAHQEVRLRVMGKFGALLYKGQVDVAFQLGVLKKTRTRQLVASRPEILLDYYPLTGSYGSILIYNVAWLPYSNDESHPASKKAENEGTTYTLGFAPTLVLPLIASKSKFDFIVGTDIHSQFSSRRQYIDDENLFRDDDDFFLTKLEEGRPIEDYVPPLYLANFIGVSVAAEFIKALNLEVFVYQNSDFRPEYYRNDEEEVVYKYQAERSSSYRIKASYALNNRLNLSNEFNHYSEGFFEGRIKSLEKTRYQNVVRITCKL